MTRRRALGALGAAALASGCATGPSAQRGPNWPTPDVLAAYGEMDDGEFVVPAIPTRYLTPVSVRQLVPISGATSRRARSWSIPMPTSSTT